MTDLNPQTDPAATPEDVATLYSWANLHGAKYRDFSAARAQTREIARLRVEQAAQEQLELKQTETEAAQLAEAEHEAEEARAAEEARQADLLAEREIAEREARELAAQQAAEQTEREARELAAEQAAAHAAQLEAEEESRRIQHEAAESAARQAEEQAAQQAEQEAARKAEMEAAERDSQRAQEISARFAEQAAQLAEQKAAHEAAQFAARKAAERAAEQAAHQLAQQRAWQQPAADRYSPPVVNPPSPPYAQPPHSYEPAAYAGPSTFRPGHNQPQTREDNARGPWDPSDTREPSGRPAWLSSEPAEPPASPSTFTPLPSAPPVPQTASSLPQAPEDTLQGSRDRLTSRWFALRGVFDGATPLPVEPTPPPVTSRAPAMAVFSLAGGVGKTSLVATLGRALSARGERVLLVDTAAFGLLPFFFGATDQRPGLLRTFNPPADSSDAPIQMVTIDPDAPETEQASQDGLSGEIVKFARGASRILVDLATASGATTRRIMRMSPLVLVPVIPDMNSVVSVSSIDAFFEHHGNSAGKPALPYYVLNQFDASLPLHLDVREVLREQLGERLLPFALRRAPAMSEALAEGMTVMDYAPGSMLAEDFNTLAGWVKSLSAPATTSYRGVRWSER